MSPRGCASGAAPLALAVVLTLALAACTSGPRPPTDDDDPGSAAGHLLEDGVVFDTDAGVRLAATSAALAEPVRVRVEPAAVPEHAPALPRGIEAVATAMHVEGERTVFVPADAYVLVGLPLSDGIAVDELAVAVLEPSDGHDPDDVGPDTDTWSILPATFDAETGTLVVGLAALSDRGHLLVPVHAPGFDSTPIPATSVGAVGAQGGVDPPSPFLVQCVGYADDACTKADRDATADVLEQVYDAWVDGLGFAEPRLARRVAVVNWGFVQIRVDRYQYQLRDVDDDACGGTNGRGAYRRGTRVAYTCYDASTAGPAHRTTRHEFFHALQYGYDAFLAARDAEPGIAGAVIEGMARAAELSHMGLRRSAPNALRVVDTPLFVVGDDPDRYRAQDFWIYLAERFGMDLDVVIPILEAGGTTVAVDAMLSSHPTYGGPTLGEAYWAWAKNQAFEKSIDIGFGVLGAPCTLNDGVVGPWTTTAAPIATPDVITVDPDGATPGIAFALQPLTSRVVSVDFPAHAGARYAARLEASLGPDVRVQFYEASDAGSERCRGRTERSTRPVAVPAGEERLVHALIANTSFDAVQTATLDVAPVPRVTIVRPAEGERTFSESEPVTFEAALTGFGGASPSIEWSFRVGSTGDETAFATSQADERFEHTGLACADLLVFARADAGADLSATAVVSVSCLGDQGRRFVNADQDISGSVDQGGSVERIRDTETLWVGDTASNDGVRTMLTFPLSLPDAAVSIDSATLSFRIDAIDGFPYTSLGDLRAYRTDYGDDLDADDYAAFGLPGAAVLPFDGSTTTGGFDADVTTIVREAHAAGDERLQVIVHFASTTDGNDRADRIAIDAQDRPGTYLLPLLDVTYSYD